MIRISVELYGSGCLRRLEAEGHSFKAGRDFSPACAAVTALLRTGAELFAAEEGVEARISLPEEGRMFFEISGIPAEKIDRMRGVTDFLAYGLLRMARETPGDLEVTVLE